MWGGRGRTIVIIRGGGDHSYNVGGGRTIVILWGEEDHSFYVGGGGP